MLLGVFSVPIFEACQKGKGTQVLTGRTNVCKIGTNNLNAGTMHEESLS